MRVKSLLADGRVQFNAAWYDYAWQDIQLFEVFPGPPPLGGPQLNNITEAASSGVETFGCNVNRNANGNTLWGLSFEANF